MNWLRRLFLLDEDFESHINTLTIGWDQIPNPTKETREVGKIPVLAHRTTARNRIGRLLLRLQWKHRGRSGPASFTHDGSVMEVYPMG